jgi:hypothetical protein
MKGRLAGLPDAAGVLMFLENKIIKRGASNKYNVNKPKDLCVLFDAQPEDSEIDAAIKNYLKGWWLDFLRKGHWLQWIGEVYRGNLASRVWILMNFDEIRENLMNLSHHAKFRPVPEGEDLKALYDEWYLATKRELSK